MIPRSGTTFRPGRRLAGAAAAVTLAAVSLVGATGCTSRTCGGGATATPTTGGQGGGSGVVLAKGFTSRGSTSHYYSRSHEGDTGGYGDSGSSSRRYRYGGGYRNGYHTYGDDDYDNCSGASPTPSDTYYEYNDECTYSWCPSRTPSDDPYSSTD